MSYIRCLSNPEVLYIVGTGDTIDFCQGERKTKTMPPYIFHGLLKKALKVGNLDIPEVISFRGASFEYNKFGRDFKVRLKYKDWHIDMWYATWYYLVHKNKWRFE